MVCAFICVHTRHTMVTVGLQHVMLGCAALSSLVTYQTYQPRSTFPCDSHAAAHPRQLLHPHLLLPRNPTIPAPSSAPPSPQVGQTQAKKVLAVATHNHYKRLLQVPGKKGRGEGEGHCSGCHWYGYGTQNCFVLRQNRAPFSPPPVPPWGGVSAMGPAHLLLKPWHH